MPVSKRIISADNIEQSVYKAFALIGKCNKKYPKTEDIIYYINLENIIKNTLKKKYQGSYYSYNSLSKLVLFMDLNNIQNQSETERYLKKHKRVRKKLGLINAPDQPMISKFKNHYLTDETKEILSQIRDKII